MTIEIDNQIELQQLSLTDSADIFNLINSEREYLGKWLPFVEFTKQVTDTKRFITAAIEAPESDSEYIFVIRKQNEFIGLIGFKETDRTNKKTEIGYWLSEKQQKQGIITRSVEKLCQFAFNDQGINRIQIKCAVENKASINIPKKLGFKFEGIERHGEILTGNIFTDLVVYSKLKND